MNAERVAGSLPRDRRWMGQNSYSETVMRGIIF